MRQGTSADRAGSAGGDNPCADRDNAGRGVFARGGGRGRILPAITSAGVAQVDAILDGDPGRKLDDRFRIVRDRVRGVAQGYCPSLYLYGPPGVSKTFLIDTTLAEEGVTPYHVSGHITPMGLFTAFKEHREQIIVLDDVAKIFSNAAALQILMAALGKPSGPRTGREVTYCRKDSTESFIFTGAVIFIFNFIRHDDKLFAALKSRVQVYELDPAHEELVVLFRRVAAQGWSGAKGALTATECEKVAEFVIAESGRQSNRLDMRLLVDKGYADYLQHRDGLAETHWQDLIRITMRERIMDLTQPVQVRRPSRAEEQARLRQVARDIEARFPTRSERLAAWGVASGGLSESTYRRHLQVVEQTPLSV